MSGWIKLHRALLEWEWYDDQNVFRLWMHILLRANHKPSRYKGKEISAGSLVSGYPALSKQTGLSVQEARTALKKLKSTGEVTVESSSQFSIITVSKWSDFQSDDRQINSQATGNQQASNRHPTGNQQASNRQSTTSKEYNNKRNKECKNEEGKNTPQTPKGASKKKQTLTERRAEGEKIYGNHFKECFWPELRKHKRHEDDIKAIKDKYLDRRHEGYTEAQMMNWIVNYEVKWGGISKRRGARAELDRENFDELLAHAEPMQRDVAKITKPTTEDYLQNNLSVASRYLEKRGL